MSTDELNTAYRQASIKTQGDLRTIAGSVELRQLTRLSLPEIDRLSEEVARVVPAGNVPGIILSGLARLGGREVQQQDSHKHIGLLFQGMRQMVDKAVYAAFFAGPAAILYGYQRILELAGKDPDKAFPDGTWQFYLEFALREDGARHTNETTGFHGLLDKHQLKLTEAEQLMAWTLASTFFLTQLPEVLANEWRERVACKILGEVGGIGLDDVFTEWEKQRPYQRGKDAGQDIYSAYRRRKFQEFLQPYLDQLTPPLRQKYKDQLKEAEETRLPAYQTQMSWLQQLEPTQHHETRVAYTAEQANIGIIWRGHYYFIPLTILRQVDKARALIHAIFATKPHHPPATLDEVLVTTLRAEQLALRKTLDAKALQELEVLRHTPIIINWDTQEVKKPLSLLRQAKRGIGDHPLTIMRTSESIIFDQSHIFFDGVWGASVAEIMTGEALSWAVYLSRVAPIAPAAQPPYSPALQAFPALIQKAQEVKTVTETGAENTTVKLNTIMALRKLLKQRSDLALVTVNDLLLLYRGIHAVVYTPSPALAADLTRLEQDPRPDAQRAAQMIRTEYERLKGKNPALLIPLDASRHDPRERIFPTTFRNPLTDFYQQHQITLSALRAYKTGNQGTRRTEFQAFYETQLKYLRLISAFGELLTRYRKVALLGQSTSTASIRFLAHLPPVVQQLLNAIPGRFDVLNEVIKGEEVFSNMGRVAKGSTLRRFITAKDDNRQKTLAWGVMTDDTGILRISLRDFRPHVGVLYALGMADLAQRITQDYLDAYASGVNNYIGELRDITIASRETITHE